MKHLLSPKWIIVTNTFPLLLMAFIFSCDYNSIKSLLDEVNFDMWTGFTIATSVLISVNLIYYIFASIKRKLLSVNFAIASLFVNVAFAYYFLYNSEKLIPFSIMNWMLSGEPVIYILTFLMPSIIFAIFLLVILSEQSNKLPSAGRAFIYALSIPMIIYFLVQLIDDLPRISEVIITLGFILISILFIFFLIGSIYKLSIKKSEFFKSYDLIWKLLFSLLLPLVGLLVNNQVFFGNNDGQLNGMFGNFNSNWFYILAILNGVFISIPNMENRLYRLFLFLGRCSTLLFTFYFFVVFLPFLPFSLVALVVFGAGFLMLTPLVLIVIHAVLISDDYSYLKEKFDLKLVRLFGILGLLLIPCYMTISFLEDRRVLSRTLDYVYSPDYSQVTQINTESLRSTINSIKSNKDRGRERFSNYLPYISMYFHWIVMQNATLSDAKIETIEEIFFGKKKFISTDESRPVRTIGQNVELTNVISKSKYDSDKKCWFSSVDLELANSDTIFWQNEYRTIIDLPNGCWISDYYLNIEDRKEPGILSEKKAAMWVYSQIVHVTRRDPGILYYLTGNKVAFRVFPFARGEVRKTGIEFMHKEPVVLNIDGRAVKLGNDSVKVLPDIPLTEFAESGNVQYVSAKEKSTLVKTNRKPYYHFLIDASKDSEDAKQKLIRRVDRLISKNIINRDNAMISFVNSSVETISMKDNWSSIYLNKKPNGGYFLDRGIRKVLFDSYEKQSDFYPVIVTVTDSFQYSILEDDFSDFSFAFPESDLFFELDEYAILKAHSLKSNPYKRLSDSTTLSFSNDVLKYDCKNGRSVYLPDNNKPDIVLRNSKIELEEKDFSEKNWNSGLIMQGNWMSGILHPETSDRDWNALVKYSFVSKIMMPVTAFLVVENEAQKEMLKKKQKQSLSADKSLDLGEQTMSMTEPGWIISVLVFIIFIFGYKKKLFKV